MAEAHAEAVQSLLSWFNSRSGLQRNDVIFLLQYLFAHTYSRSAAVLLDEFYSGGHCVADGAELAERRMAAE
jgi:hypothetical protein